MKRCCCKYSGSICSAIDCVRRYSVQESVIKAQNNGQMLKLRGKPTILCRYLSAASRRKPLAAEHHSVKPSSAVASQRVYCWGYAASGSLGIPELLQPSASSAKFNINYPYNLLFFKQHGVKVTCCAGGCGFTLFGVKRPSKKLMGTGINTDSQLGYQELPNGKVADYICQPVDIDISGVIGPTSNIIDIAAGRAHTLILTSEHKAFSFGNNGYGQCGRPVLSDERYSGSKIIHEVDVGEPIKRVYAGQDHSMLLTKSGRVFTFGISTDGQLGRECTRGFDATPALVKGALANVRIKDMTCRSDTVLAISEDGVLYGWGNNEYSQLKQTSASLTQLLEPFDLPVSKIGPISSCAAGSTACVAIESSRAVYSWGYGALGRGPGVIHDSAPKEIPNSLFGKNDFNPFSKLKSVTSGIGSFFVTTESGELYAWGRNKMGTCGLGLKEADQFFPLKMNQRLMHRAMSSNTLKATPENPDSLLAKLIANSPPKVRPYLQLTRVDRPIGIYLLLLPTCWGTAFATNAGSLPNIQLMTLFFLGATFMRAAGCIVNDIWDRKLDLGVERCRTRPIASGAVNPYAALAFAGGLSLTSAALVLLPLNLPAQIISLSIVPLVIAYPAAKRYTGWPQVVLGLTFNWGVLVGYVASTADPATLLTNYSTLASLLSMYSAGVCWTLFYDTVYAYQDYKDDEKVGVFSTARTWGRGASGRRYLTFFGSAFVASLGASMYLGDIPTAAAVLGLTATSGHLAWQMRLIGDLENKAGECGRAFRSNATLGLIVLLTIVAGRIFQS